jgi:hypothetical protein
VRRARTRGLAVSFAVEWAVVVLTAPVAGVLSLVALWEGSSRLLAFPVALVFTVVQDLLVWRMYRWAVVLRAVTAFLAASFLLGQVQPPLRDSAVLLVVALQQAAHGAACAEALWWWKALPEEG